MSPTRAPHHRQPKSVIQIEERTMPLGITDHACEQFINRCRPGLDDPAARGEVRRLLSSARVHRERPDKLSRSSTANFAYVEIADVVFTVQQARSDGTLVLTTAMTPPARGARARQTARRQRRNVKRAERENARSERRAGQRRREQRRRHARSTRS